MKIDWLIYVNIFTAGTLIVPIVPIGLNFSSELTFPQAPTVVTGFVLMTGCIGGFILAIVNSILAQINPLYAIGLMAVLTSIAAIFSIFIQEDLKRYKFSQKQQGGLKRTISMRAGPLAAIRNSIRDSVSIL